MRLFSMLTAIVFRAGRTPVDAIRKQDASSGRPLPGIDYEVAQLHGVIIDNDATDVPIAPLVAIPNNRASL